MQHPTNRIRNVALIGHGGVGKTTLAEALLHRAGVTKRAGSVAEGTTVTDTEPEEIARQMTISMALAPFEWKATDGNTYKVNLIDTPGYPDFSSEVDAALSVADLAVIVVSAVDGVEVGTETAWEKCEALGTPRLVFVTREDKNRADFRSVVAQLRAAFGNGCTPIELPLGEEESLHGVADVLTEEALEYDGDGVHRNEPLPDDIVEEEHRLHDQLVEEIVAGDDEQLERYLSGDVPSAAELERTLAHEVLECIEFPVLLGSGTTGVGVDRLADMICEIGPSPAERPTTVVAGTEEVPVTADAAGESLVYVFKTIADQYVGQLSLFKVLSGTIHADDHLVDSVTGNDERLHGLVELRGSEQQSVPHVVAGDLGAVAKLAGASTGSTLAPRGRPVRVPVPARSQGGYAVALEPVTQSDDDKLSAALQRLVAEDPALTVTHDDETHQTVLRGTGDMHLAVAIARMERKFGVHVTTRELRVPYRETITTSVEREGRLKKQSGGHGQFAVANLRVSPLERSAGFEFVDAIVGGAIPKQYVAAVQKGVEEAMASGDAFGFPVVDVRVECYDGKTHSVDSSDMAFKTAAATGFKEAVAAAQPVILEPIAKVSVVVPASMQGDVLGDISSRRGRVVANDSNGDGRQTITAYVPTAELRHYAMELRSLTGGRGTFEYGHDHYDVLPAQLVDTVKKEAAAP